MTGKPTPGPWALLGSACTANRELEAAGYDGLEAVKALPELMEALRDLLRGTRVHAHKRGTDADPDKCAECGHDIRDWERHIYAGDGTPADVLAKAQQATDDLLRRIGASSTRARIARVNRNAT